MKPSKNSGRTPDSKTTTFRSKTLPEKIYVHKNTDINKFIKISEKPFKNSVEYIQSDKAKELTAMAIASFVKESCFGL